MSMNAAIDVQGLDGSESSLLPRLLLGQHTSYVVAPPYMPFLTR